MNAGTHLWLTSAAAVLLAGCATDSQVSSCPRTDRPSRLAFITCARDAKVFEPVKRGT
jgi:hypothetical protein